MLAVVAASSVVSALPLPHPQLSESEFRSFPDDMEEAKHNKVVISSGYSNVGGMNIEFLCCVGQRFPAVGNCYVLPRQDSKISQIPVNGRVLPSCWVTL